MRQQKMVEVGGNRQHWSKPTMYITNGNDGLGYLLMESMSK
jgi:hypothetical protein